MTRRFRILHVITRLELGGAQQNTLHCVTHHDRSRFDVELLAGRGGVLDDLARAIPDAHVELVDYLRHPIAPVADLKALFALKRYLRDHEIDLIHTHSSKAGILGRLAARMAGVPVVVHTVHGWSFNPTQSAWRRALYLTLERFAAGRTDRMIAVSEENRERGIELGIGRPEGYALIRSGIDLSACARPARTRAAMREDLGVDDGTLLVGTLANFKAQKGPLDFIEAAAIAHRRDPRLRFIYAGDGPMRGEVEAAIARHGLDEVVQLLGWRDDPIELLHACDLYLLTSRFEGLPRSVLQAMACGLPVVATRTDGTPEVVIDGETGLLAPPGDVEAIAARLLEMAGDRALRERCAAAARQRLDEAFDIDAMVDRLDDLYAELLG